MRAAAADIDWRRGPLLDSDFLREGRKRREKQQSDLANFHQGL
jgi:hypothetical protein